jgi:hypothetical protein
LITLKFVGAENTDTSPPAKRCLDGGEVTTTIDLEVGASANRSKCKKITKRRKLGQKVNCICFDCWIHQSIIGYYFSNLSLSPRRSDSGTAFMGTTHSGPLSHQWVMIEDSTEEFHTASSRGGDFDLPSPRRFGVGALPAPITTPPWQEDASAIQSMMTVQPQALAP